MTKKNYFIEKIHRGRSSIYKGTLEELVTIFSYTLECGYSYNHRINCNPKTINSLVLNLNKSVMETQGSCYDQDTYCVSSEECYVNSLNK